MRLHRFYVPNTDFAVGKKVELSASEHLHQWKNVFRLEVGDEIVVFNGAEEAEYRAKFVTLSKTEAELEILEKREVEKAKREVSLYVALIKKDRFEWLVEKATELGVARICPVLSERTEVKGVNSERVQKIAIEAVEQSGQCRVPRIEEIVTLKIALEQAINPFVCDIGAQTAASSFSGTEPISIFIGPEGGWSPAEKALFTEKKVPTISFGKNTLRAETAALVSAVLALDMSS